MPLHASGEPLWFAAITSGFMNPVAEEFLVRGLFLGPVALLVYKSKKNVKITSYSVALIFISYIFTISHNNVTDFQFMIRFVDSILYGILYLANKRNLLPAVIAHASSNWFLILKDIIGF